MLAKGPPQPILTLNPVLVSQAVAEARQHDKYEIARIVLQQTDRMTK